MGKNNVNIKATPDELRATLQVKDTMMRNLVAGLQRLHQDKNQLESSISLLAADIERDKSILSQLEEEPTNKNTK